MARKLEISRESLYNYLSQLESGHLLITLKTKGKSISTLQKPDKIYLENTNWAYSLTTNPDPGNLRETFALNQLLHGKLKVNLPAKGDFVINKDLYIEVRGKKNGQQQVKNYKNHIVASDGIETGFGKKFPLWLLRFLY
ncbi:hypothetical protein [Membranihabitans maritimus]|uniref:hypothetical protein n=1 Tax=Membranihabitans maritimus TaxID=2904244 RepID=UPI001F3BC93A|nr:hypothetical protein [Membranihabitans maritimus]